MSDEKQETDPISATKLINKAVREIEAGLMDRGMTQEASRPLAEAVRPRIYVSETGELRFRYRFGDAFHPHDHRRPYQGIVSEVYAGAGAEGKATIEITEEQRRQKRQSGIY